MHDTNQTDGHTNLINQALEAYQRYFINFVINFKKMI